MYQAFMILALGLFSNVSLAADPIVFKQPFSLQHGWLMYGFALVVLLVIVLIIAKKHRPGLVNKSVCQLVEKKYLGNKTVVYVIDYQQQRFLLADNQHALALHALTKGDKSELL